MKTSIRRLFARFSALPEQTTDRSLFIFGVALACGELYKQLFLYYHINHEAYDWWFFPFQLCSLPMYFCLLMPFLRRSRLKTAIDTFMQDFNLMGGIAALAVPEGFSNIHWSLTLHGYVWHILLIVIGLYIWICGRADLSKKGFLHTIPVFAVCCCIATFINITAPGHRADMFYISPYHPSTQIIFHDLALRLGIQTANLLYLGTVCMGGGVMHLLFRTGKKRILGSRF